jgi:hypothetical protein
VHLPQSIHLSLHASQCCHPESPYLPIPRRPCSREIAGSSCLSLGTEAKFAQGISDPLSGLHAKLPSSLMFAVDRGFLWSSRGGVRLKYTMHTHVSPMWAARTINDNNE